MLLLGVLVGNAIGIDRHLYLRYRYVYGSDDAGPRRHSNGALEKIWLEVKEGP